MAMTKAEITIGVDQRAKVASGSGRGEDDFTLSQTTAYGIGTGAGNVSKQYNASRSISGAASDNCDLSGSLVDRTGAAMVFTAIKSLYLKNTGASGNITYGGGTNAVPGLPAGTLAPGERLVWDAGLTSSGKAVTAGTGDIFAISSDASASYEIAVTGN